MFSKRANGKSQMNSPESKRIEYMRTEHIHLVVLAILLICAFAVCLGKGEETNMASHLQERLQVVGKQLREAREKLQAMDQKFFKDYIPLNETPDATFNDPDPPSYLGNKVMIDGDVNGDGFDDIWVGDGYDSRAFLFYGGKDIDFSSPALVFSGENRGDCFSDQSGMFADINNDGYDNIVVGARLYNGGDGRVYVFYGGPDMDIQADLTFDGEAGKKGWFGLAVATGDIDNDGYVDVLVGAQCYDQGRGRVYLYWGGEAMDTSADIILEGEGFPGGKPEPAPGAKGTKTQGWFGRRIDVSGDVNGDGYNDILIGARHAGGKESNGAAYLFLGNTQEKMDSVCDYTFRGESPNAQMGSALELFDVDNDGFDDVIIGVRYADHARGKVYIHWGAKDFDANKPAVVLDGESYKSNMPSDCITCGHIDDDDYGDILCGALHYPPYKMSDGRAYLFCGNRKQLMDVECDMVFDPQEDHNNFGSLSISLGDVNNDGYLDALFAAGGQLPECNGKAFLYYGPLVENHTSNDEVLDGTKEKQQTKKAAKKEIQSLKEQIDQLEQEYAMLIAGAAPAAAASYVLCW